MRFFLIGFMGCGKSFWARKIHEELNFPFFDLDGFIEQEEEASIQDIFDSQGEASFRKLEGFYLRELIEQQNQFVMACGGGTACYGGNMELMNNSGITIYLRTTADFLYQRLSSETDKRPMIKNKSANELRQFVKQTLAKRAPYYSKATYITDAASCDLSTFKNIIDNYV